MAKKELIFEFINKYISPKHAVQLIKSFEKLQQIAIKKGDLKTAERFNLDVEQLCGKSRMANIALPRQIAMYLSKKLTSHSLEEVGKRFGGRNHATVIHAMHVVDTLMSQKDDIRRTVEFLKKTLSS